MGTSSWQHGAIAQSLAGIVGEANCYTWETMGDRWQARIQAAIAPAQPVAALVCPTTPEALAAAVAYSHQERYPMLPCGCGSKLGWGGLVSAATTDTPLIVISTERLNRLIDHAVGDLTVTVEAGLSFATLQAQLAQAGQGLAIDPAFSQAATIGGIVATADTGSLRQRYSSVRDMLLGIAFVRADGQMAKAGGRVVKNVAGYDLMKLFTGSYGTLGILTQMTFRVYPLPAASQTVVLTGDWAAIAQLSQTLLQSALTPVKFDLLSAAVINSLGLGASLGMIVQFQGITASVAEQVSKVTALGQTLQLTSQTFAEADEIALWQRLQERMTEPTASSAIACKIGIQPSEAIALLQAAPLSLPGWYAQIHLASGLGKLLTDTAPPAETVQQVRAICQKNSGFLSVLAAPTPLKQHLDVWGYTGNGLTIMREIKRQFDPHSLLSPQRFVGGI